MILSPCFVTTKNAGVMYQFPHKATAVRLLRGPTRTFQAKEVPRVVLAPGHRVSPV